MLMMSKADEGWRLQGNEVFVTQTGWGTAPLKTKPRKVFTGKEEFDEPVEQYLNR